MSKISLLKINAIWLTTGHVFTRDRVVVPTMSYVYIRLDPDSYKSLAKRLAEK